MANNLLRQLLHDVEPIRRSPGGEGYYSFAGSLTLVHRCKDLGVAAASPEAFEYDGVKVKCVGILDLSRDLAEPGDWPTKYERANERVLQFITSYEQEKDRMLFTLVIFSDPEDGVTL